MGEVEGSIHLYLPLPPLLNLQWSKQHKRGLCGGENLMTVLSVLLVFTCFASSPLDVFLFFHTFIRGQLHGEF